ncbi:MAG: glycosylhydrolase-like jelly roll fold domain-containing protein [Bacteroidales bacterium]
MKTAYRFFPGFILTGLLVAFLGCSSDPSSKLNTGKANNPPNFGQRKPVTFDMLRKNFSNPDMIYAPFVFWFWDEPLNQDKMAEMARVMGSQGFNPGYAHARHSMVGTPSLPDEEWLGEKWFNSFDAALTEAEKQQKYLGYCDEYWWPSFQANGRVLKQYPELRAESLNWQIIDADGGTAVKVPASYFAVAAQLAKPVEVTPPQAQFGKWIWSPDGKEMKHSCRFRYSFEILVGRTISRASIRITADNGFILYINGQRIGEGSEWEKPVSFDLTKVLDAGKNLLAIECNNIDGPFGLIAGLLATLDDGKTIKVHTDQTWMTSLSSKKGWELQDFECVNWKPAREIANTGDNPWSSVTNAEEYKPALILSKTLQLIGSGDSFTWNVPIGEMWRVYVFNKYYHPGAADGQQSNSIDSRLGSAFIKTALEPYAQRFSGRMGKSIPGDFIDHEGDYGWQLAWSGSLDSSFLARHGRNIRLSLPLMLDTDEEGLSAKARWEWFDLVSDLYAGNFQAVTDWHEKRGMYTTAHVWEEGIQPQVNCVGDHLKLLRALTMPGQDCLGLKALRVHDFKEAQSVSEFENVRFASEVLGASDFESGKGLWGTFTPSLLKQSVNAFTAWGVSHVIPHGVFTTRKLSGNPWPPDWYNESPMFPYMHLWTDFTRRASYINSMGSTVPDVLLYNPMETAWINANAPLLDVNGMWSFTENLVNGKRINAIDKVYAEAINDLTNARVEFLVGDRYYLKQMKLKKGKLVLGTFAFSTIVLPEVEILTLEAAKKIVDFAKAGGRVYCLGELPLASADNGMNDPKMKKLMDALKAMPTFTACTDSLESWLGKSDAGLESTVRFSSGAFPMLQQHRRIDGKDFFWMVNNGDQKQVCEVNISGAHGAASIWDCETGEIRTISSMDVDDGSNIRLTFKPLEAYWLVLDPDSPVNKVNEKPEAQDLITVTGTWKVTYDAGIQPAMEFPLTPPAEFVAGIEKQLEDWKVWGLQKFSGLMDYYKSINIEKIDKQMFLDLGKVCHVAEVWINGQSVGAKMWGPHVFDISGVVKPGRNEIRVRIANLINNSYGDMQESGLIGPVQIRGLDW